MIKSVRGHLLHHARFYLSALLGAVVWGLTQVFPLESLPPPLPILLAGNAFFALYLLLTTLLALYEAPSKTRSRAGIADEGFFLIGLMTLAAIALSLGSIFALLNQGARVSHAGLFLAIANVPLGWLTLHMASAFHYAHLYYREADAGAGKRADRKGLQFPETEEPVMWDFLYYSFVIGMTAQVSDVQVLTTAMRRATMIHSIVSFFFNTVLLALAVNVVVAQAR